MSVIYVITSISGDLKWHRQKYVPQATDGHKMNVMELGKSAGRRSTGNRNVVSNKGVYGAVQCGVFLPFHLRF